MALVAARTSVGQLPNFLIIGAMKAGTSSLYHYLRVHPQVFMPAAKELSFFAREPEGRRNLEWYRKQFVAARPDATAVGEASTMYTKYPRIPGVPERIEACIPRAKLIYVVRDPIERIRSHYQHRVAVGAERAPLERAVFEKPIYLDCSRYAMQIERYLRCFPREQLLVITSESLRNDRQATVTRVYEFLGVDADFVPPNLDREFYRTDERVPYPPLAWRMRRALKKRFPLTGRIRFGGLPPVRALGRLYDGMTGARWSAPPAPTDETRDELVRLLREDVRRLHAYMPAGFDGWGIA